MFYAFFTKLNNILHPTLVAMRPHSAQQQTVKRTTTMTEEVLIEIK